MVPIGAPLSAVVSQEEPDTYVGIQAMFDVYAFARMLRKSPTVSLPQLTWAMWKPFCRGRCLAKTKRLAVG